jgi:septal ring factor EnvC (AmiA/AmiB activator)
MINPPFNPFVKVRSLARSWVKKIPIYRRHIEQVDQLKNELANERRKTNIVLEQLGNVSSDYQHLTATSRQLQAESNQLQNEKDRTESHLNLIIAQVRHTSKKQKERTQTLETQLSHAQVQLKTARRQGALEIIDKAQSIASRRVMQAYATKMLRDGNGTTTYEQDANELHSFGVSRDAARALVDSEKENRAQTERIAMLQATRLPDAAKSLSQLRGYQIPFAI